MGGGCTLIQPGYCIFFWIHFFTLNWSCATNHWLLLITQSFTGCNFNSKVEKFLTWSWFHKNLAFIQGCLDLAGPLYFWASENGELCIKIVLIPKWLMWYFSENPWMKIENLQLITPWLPHLKSRVAKLQKIYQCILFYSIFLFQSTLHSILSNLFFSVLFKLSVTFKDPQ